MFINNIYFIIAVGIYKNNSFKDKKKRKLYKSKNVHGQWLNTETRVSACNFPFIYQCFSAFHFVVNEPEIYMKVRIFIHVLFYVIRN